jgi:DNA-directed RNA polymerase subunit H (RpoH/RPB5)
MQRLLDIKRTQIQMIRDRGYNVDAELPVLNYDVPQFLQHIGRIQQQMVTPDAPKPSVRSALSRVYASPDRTRTVLVYYGAPTGGTELPVVVVRDLLRVMRSNNIREAVLIGEANPSFAGRSEIDAYVAENGVSIQFFKESDLTYNVTEHVDVPVHNLVPKAEEAELLRSMKTDKRHMLVIRSIDPIVRYYNWSVGDVVRIERDDRAVSVLAPKSVNYRVIIP